MNDDQPQRLGKNDSTQYLARRKFRERLANTGFWAVTIGSIVMAAAWGNPDDPLAQLFRGIGLRLSFSSLFFFCLIAIPLTDRTLPSWRDFIENKFGLCVMGVGWLMMNSVALASFGWWEPPTWWERLAISCLFLGFLLISVDVDRESNDEDSCKS